MVIRNYRVRVFESRISYLMQEGDGADWLDRISEEIEDLAWARAPKRSTELANSHQVSRLPGTNQYSARFQIENFARHAFWVHEGTIDKFPGPPWIRSTRGYTTFMRKGEVVRAPAKMGPIPGAGPTWQIRVRGQEPQPWLNEAGQDVADRFR